MLILQIHEKSSEDYVVIRDETGREVCRVFVSEVRGDKARLGFVAPHQIAVNRREIDREKFPAGWKPKTTPTCAICKCPLHVTDDDGTGAHRVCAERELNS